MPRHLRYQSTERAQHLITARCLQGYSLLRPSPQLNRTIAGCLARALEHSEGEVELHHYVIMSNHFHLIITSYTSHAKARFMCHLSSNIAREVCRAQRWSEHVWGGRYHSHELVDEAALISAYKYLFKNSVKEGLVDHPREWPGLHGWRQLCAGEQVLGEWVERAQLFWARQTKKGANATERDFTRMLPVTLTRPTCWASWSEGEYRARCVEWAEEATREAREELAERWAQELRQRGLTRAEATLALCMVVGAQAVCAEEVFIRRAPSRSPRPLCRSGCPRRFLEYMTGYREFKERFLEASARLRAAVARGRAIPQVVFPVGGVPFYVGVSMT